MPKPVLSNTNILAVQIVLLFVVGVSSLSVTFPALSDTWFARPDANKGGVAQSPQFNANIGKMHATGRNGKNASAIDIPYSVAVGTSKVAWSLEKKTTISKPVGNAKVKDEYSWSEYPVSAVSKPDASGKGTIHISA